MEATLGSFYRGVFRLKSFLSQHEEIRFAIIEVVKGQTASLPRQNHSLFLFKNLRLIHHFFFLFLNTIKYFLIYLNQWFEKLGGNFTRPQCPVEANAFSRLRVFSCRKQREYFEWSSEIQAPWFLLPSRKKRNVSSYSLTSSRPAGIYLLPPVGRLDSC